jgi:ketosteroid isomerase-like protein
VSEENAEAVRRTCEAWERGELETWLETLHPDVVWDTTHFEGWLEGAIYRGRDAVRHFLVDEWRGSWDRYEARVEEVADAGDRVLVFWSQRMVGAGSGVPVVLDSAQVCTVRDGKLARVDNYTDRAEALKAVGLSE